MDEQFSLQQREELIEREFTDEQIEYLESLGMDIEGLFLDVTHLNDGGQSPDDIIQEYMEANPAPPAPPASSTPAAGGKRRRSKKSRRSRKSKKSRRSRKSRK
jgi:ribosomal protein L12E/L44/L45/RPP1/RPP2